MSSSQLLLHLRLIHLFLSVWMEPVNTIHIQSIPPYPAVGQSVTLSVTGINGNIRQFIWYKGPNTGNSNIILIYTLSANQPQSNGLQYFSRASGLPNASLQISDLEITDGGNYTVIIQTPQPVQQTSVNLTVYEPTWSRNITEQCISPYSDISRPFGYSESRQFAKSWQTASKYCACSTAVKSP
uniref:Immunoglobulin domain-containing protein n=1 Tax=Leptobrachium leishanense TaxID=445787 RepID=A0A8C5QBY0_9ANUR